MDGNEVSLPENLYYSKDHEWVLIEENGLIRIGITDYAQKKMHEIVFVDLPSKDFEVKQMGVLGTAESVKAVSEIFSPVSGQVVEVNEELALSPELVNQDPYGKGWMVLIKPSNLKLEKKKLMKPKEYIKYIKTLLHKKGLT